MCLLVCSDIRPVGVDSWHGWIPNMQQYDFEVGAVSLEDSSTVTLISRCCLGSLDASRV